MPTGLKRFQQTKQFHFITFSCYKRQPLLHTDEAKNIVQQILEQTRKQQSLRIAAYVLMPEHIHLLTNEPAKETLATFLQILKQLTSRQLKSPDQKQFWQTRYYDFNVSSIEKYIEKVQYIHRNPVTVALSSSPKTTAGAASTTTPLANPALLKSNPTDPPDAVNVRGSRSSHTQTLGCPILSVLC
jgi:putative transposase